MTDQMSSLSRGQVHVICKSGLHVLATSGLFFDGKKSKVRQEENGEVDFPTIDHYTMISQPDKQYCGFCRCDGTGT